MNAIEREQAEAAAIAREFPGWEAWVGTDRLWHARLKGRVPGPGDYVTGEDETDLRDQIRRWTGKHQESGKP